MAGSTIDLLVADIDAKLQALDYNRGWRGAELPKEVASSSVLSPAALKQWIALQKLDREFRAMRATFDKQRAKFEKLIKGKPFMIDKRHAKGNDGWYLLYLRETQDAAENRVGNTKLARAQKRDRLRAIRQAAMVTAERGGSIVDYINEVAAMK